MKFPEGFKISGVQDDEVGFGLIHAPGAMKVSGLLTTNSNPAEPIKYCQKMLGRPSFKAMLVNRGSANAATGEEGEKRMLALLEKTAKELKIEAEDILPASTGVIGEQIEYSEDLFKELLSRKKEVDPQSFATAIMTTDTVEKIVWSSFDLGGHEVTIFGAAKGSGMICPNMATMLTFIMTDADLSQELLDKALSLVVNKSFNLLTVDGETSTNDSAFLLSSGKSSASLIDKEDESYEIFLKHLESVALTLTEKLASDGEGATKFIKIEVHGAIDDAEANKAAKVIGNYPLCKTAFYGASPNWGRIISALGGAGIGVNLEEFSVYVDGAALVHKGENVPSTAKQAHEVMLGGKYVLEIELGKGDGSGTCYTCDYSPEYIRINAHYLS